MKDAIKKQTATDAKVKVLDKKVKDHSSITDAKIALLAKTTAEGNENMNKKITLLEKAGTVVHYLFIIVTCLLFINDLFIYVLENINAYYFSHFKRILIKLA